MNDTENTASSENTPEEKLPSVNIESKELDNAERLRTFCSDNRIPIHVERPELITDDYHVKLLNHLGFVLTFNDGHFFHADFPDGWRKEIIPASDTWCYLIDNKGRKRAAIFYKHLGSHEDSHVNYMSRYTIRIDHKVPFNHEKSFDYAYYNSPLYAFVEDSGTILWQSAPLAMRIKISQRGLNQRLNRAYAHDERKKRNILFNKAKQWLAEKYPEYDNILAYWDEKKPAVEFLK